MSRGRPLRWAIPLLLASCGCAALFGGDREPQTTAALGSEYFHTRDLGSEFQTGVPYALALAAIERYPDQLGGSRAGFAEKFGLRRRPEADSLPVGIVLHRNGLTGLDFAMTNCSFCHDGEIDGRRIPGLGNRDLRLNALNQAVVEVVRREDFNAETMIPLAKAAAKRRGTPWGWRGAWAARTAIKRLKERARAGDAFGGVEGVDAGPGRNTPIEFAKAASKVPIEPPYGFVKYPAVWVYGKRATFGYDGSIVGDRVMALSAVEFNKRMPANDIVHRREMWSSLYDYITALEPPRYPAAVDTAVAARGREVFLGHCAGCHGRYGRDAEPDQYREQVVPIEIVGTDPDRLQAVTPALVEARSKGPLARYVHVEAAEGYVPPPLDGIWCRGPYLHNGSVPTLADLLRPAHERPTSFYVGAGTGYDLERVGLAYEEGPSPEGGRAGGRASERQSRFDTRQAGNHNQGHDFGAVLTAEQRRQLLEYLKQL